MTEEEQQIRDLLAKSEELQRRSQEIAMISAKQSREFAILDGHFRQNINASERLRIKYPQQE